MKFGASVYLNEKKHAVRELNSRLEDGFDYIELTIGNEAGREEIKSFISECATRGFDKKIKVLHLPELNFDDIRPTLRIAELFENVDIDIFNVHIFSNQRSQNFNKKMEAMKELIEALGINHKIMTIENTEEGVAELKTVFHELRNAKFCLDAGHANLFSDYNRSGDFLDEFSDILYLVHLHDNAGGNGEKYDTHLALGKGNIDFKQLFSKLKKKEYGGYVTLELYNADTSEWKASLGMARMLAQSSKNLVDNFL